MCASCSRELERLGASYGSTPPRYFAPDKFVHGPPATYRRLGNFLALRGKRPQLSIHHAPVLSAHECVPAPLSVPRSVQSAEVAVV